MNENPPVIPQAKRTSLPIVRLFLGRRSLSTQGKYVAQHFEMTAWEAFFVAGLFYLTSLAFIGACMLPGLAILPLGQFISWPILFVAHLLGLHLTLIAVSKLADLLGLASTRRLNFQSFVMMGGLTVLAVLFCFVGKPFSRIAGVWLAFIAANLFAAGILKARGA